MLAYKVLHDVFDKPALLLKTKLRKSIYQQGKKTIEVFHYIMLGASGVFGLLILFLLENQIISHIKTLTNSVSKIGSNPKIFKLFRNKVPGNFVLYPPM